MKISFSLFSLAMLFPLVCGAGCVVAKPSLDAVAPFTNIVTPTSTEKIVDQTTAIVFPIDHATDRVTKKPFGLFVEPGKSPVMPERFRGYHTGVDFETTADEQTIDVPIRAICSGPLLLKKVATGYGGVAVQQCRIDTQDVTVIYGHLKFTSISAKISQELNAGDALGVLGKGFSTETDGERKHLHLGIHKGTSVNLLGYVQNTASLGQWLDVRALF